ncbi:hypothetical protein K438DRAFT_1761175 [Mycena galopus ATCC 62051]|nr:hypothetical protein K438DRAFT_1761175 [Mycena galopus ATCC 62051]
MPPREGQLLFLSHFVVEATTLRQAVIAGGNVLNAPYHTLAQPALRKLLDLVNSGKYTPDPNDAQRPSDLTLLVDEAPDLEDVDPVRIYRDVDSVIIIKTKFPWTAEYGVFTLWPSPAVMGQLHAQAEFTDADGNRVSRDPVQDYGIWWGSCGPNSWYTLYLMLPQFADAELPSDLVVRSALYGFLVKAIKHYEPERAAGLAPDYESEINRAKGFHRSSKQSKSTKLISAVHGAHVANYVMTKLRDLEWGRGAYFLLQIRGVKDLTRDLPNNDLARRQIQRLLANVAQQDAFIWVDVGLEIHPPPNCGILPCRDSHQELMELLLGITPEEWARVAGGRWSFAANPVTAAGISYIQVHTTDKAALYNASTRSKVPTLAGMQVLKLNDAEGQIPLVEDVYGTLHKWRAAKTAVVLRVEARVPLRNVGRVFPILGDIDLGALRSYVFVVDAETIWSWRLNRTMGLYLLFRMTAAADRPARKDTHADPPNNQWDRNLCLSMFESGCGRERVAQTSFYSPHHDTTKVPVMNRGAMWLPEVSYPDPAISNVLRVKNPKDIWQPTEIGKLFNVHWAEIQNLHTRPTGGTPGLMVRDVRPARSIAPRETEIANDFAMSRNDQVFDHGHDLPVEAHIGEIPCEMTAGELFVALIVNVLGQIGMTKERDRNYLDLDAAQRSLVGPNTFRHNSLLTYFPACYWTKSNTAWAATRNLLFPSPKSAVNYATNQGWKRVPNFLLYCAALERVDGIDVHRLCVEQFDKLLWFPQLDKGKLFEYKARHGDGFNSMGNITTSTRAVMIVWNPQATAIPSITKSPHAVLDENALEAFRVLRQEARNKARDDDSDQERRSPSPEVVITQVRRVRMPKPTRELLRGVKRAHYLGDAYRDDSPRPRAIPRREEEEESFN